MAGPRLRGGRPRPGHLSEHIVAQVPGTRPAPAETGPGMTLRGQGACGLAGSLLPLRRQFDTRGDLQFDLIRNHDLL